MSETLTPEQAAGKWLDDFEQQADIVAAVKTAWRTYRSADTDEQTKQALQIALDELIARL